MNITRGDIIVYSTPINEGSRRVFELMQEDYITLVFKSDKPIYFKVGDKVGDFEITDLVVPDFDEISNSYNYDIRFDAYYWKWKNKKFFHNPKIGAREASWALTANLPTHLNVVLRNLEYLGYTFNGTPFEFNIDNTVDNKSLLLRFDDLNIIDALTQIAEAYECEWWITDNIINFGRCEYGDVVGFEIGVNVEKMEREASQNIYATRVYAFGSARNIPRDYRPAVDELLVNSIGEKRLMMPKGVDYIDAYEGMTQEEAIEEIVIFDDVYPSRDNTITEVRVVEGVREDKEKFYTYYIKDDSFIFDEKWVLGTDDNKLKLTFKSGLLNGHTYVLKYHQTTNEFEINRNTDYGEELPNDRLYPKVGDVFNLFGYDTKYVDENLLPEAEMELERRARAYVEKSKIDPSVYRCSMMSDYMTNRTFEVGDRVRLLNKAFFEDGRESRIIGYEYPLDIPYDSPTYIVGETARYSTLGDLKDKVEELVYKDKIYQSTGAGVYVVGQYDNTEPTDRNVLSSKRSLNSFHRKDKTDSTDYLQKFNKGAEFGLYGKKKGAYINEEGIGDFEKVVSKATDFKEMHSDKAIIDVATINDLVTKLAKIHKLEVTDTATILKSVVKEYLSSETFVSGFAGEGFRIAQAINGDWNLEIDNLIVRKLFNVFEVVVQKISYQGGMIIRSACGGKITKVVDGGSYWRCEHDGIDDFAKDDQVLCQNFKVLTGDAEVKRYWRLATSAGKGYVNLSKTDMEANSSIPKVGDEIVQLGNRTNINRQSAQIVSVVGTDAPYLDNYAGISSYSLKDKLVTREGNLNGIIDKDFGQLKGCGLYANNAYLKGILRLTNGKTVEQELLTTNNNVEANRLELGGKIDNATAIAKDAQGKIEGLEIGGRNYVLKTSGEFSKDNIFYTSNNIIEGILDKELYTISFYYKYDNVKTGSSRPQDYRFGVESPLLNGGNGNYYAGCWVWLPKNSDNLNGEGRASNSIWIYKGTNSFDKLPYYKQVLSGDVKIWGLKLEKGNKPTDWTRAEEDYEAELNKQITNIRTDFDVIEGQININVAKTEQLVNQTTNLVEETKQTATQVNQTATEINQNVSRAEESATRAETAETNINTKADSIVMEASKQSAEKAIEGLEIGGRNLIKDSKELVYVGEHYRGIKRSKSEDHHNGYVVEKDNGNWANIKFNIEKEDYSIYNVDYAFSVDVFYLGGEQPINPKFYTVTTGYRRLLGTLVNGKWARLYLVFKPTNDKYWNPHLGFEGCEGEYYFKNLKAEKGNKPTDWSPAPEDYEAQFQATNSKLELLSDKFSVEVSKTDGIRTDLTRVEQGFDDYKIEIVGNINNAIDDNNEVIKSSFEMKDNKISLLGSEIDITGKVTFTALDSESQGKINTANDNANTANNAIGQLKTDLGDLAYEDMVSIAKLDNTIIEGGFIKTSLIEANSITADKINVQSLESVRIRTGNLDVLEGATIAGFEIGNGRIGNTRDGTGEDSYMSLYNDFFKVGNRDSNIMMGKDVLPATVGGAITCNTWITNKNKHDEHDPTYVFTQNIGLNVEVGGSGNDTAINLNGGGIAGFGIKPKVISNYENGLEDVDQWNQRWCSFKAIDDNSSFYVNGLTKGDLGIRLPYPTDAYVGKVITFLPTNSKIIFHVGNEGMNGTPYIFNKQGQRVARVELSRGGWIQFVNLGNIWVYI